MRAKSVSLLSGSLLAVATMVPSIASTSPSRTEHPTCRVPSIVIDRTLAGPAKRSPGAVVVGIVDRSGNLVRAWGTVKGKPANADTIFETASVSKVFSGILLAQALDRKEIGLRQSAQSAVNEHVPAFGQKPITVYQLATHTSGLPLWPGNRAGTTCAYGPDCLYRYLNGYKLDSAPGSTMIYSNVGFALLGQALVKRAGAASYQDLLFQRVCQPLGMNDTCVVLNSAQRSRLAQGHNPGGGLMAASAPTAGGGADGVRSTVRDMMKLMSAFIGTTPTKFEHALRTTYARYEGVDDTTDSGFGWYIDKPTGIVEKSGNLAGYRSYIAFSPTKHVAVVILSSCSGFAAPSLGKRLLKQAAEFEPGG